MTPQMQKTRPFQQIQFQEQNSMIAIAPIIATNMKTVILGDCGPKPKTRRLLEC